MACLAEFMGLTSFVQGEDFADDGSDLPFVCPIMVNKILILPSAMVTIIQP
jgi:hypothetical protein